MESASNSPESKPQPVKISQTATPLDPLNKAEAADVIQQLAVGVRRLREIRDKQLWKEGGGFRSFRHWCVCLYGERLGIFIDETL
jgi:hypothetical protein